mmetsp:Transcript_10644/g.26921  ORF Transcript_10644/g.26921 Transcript_10644/m.26921 type:complete len:312 (+) Transcript_10644:75-1010(+)
MSTVPCSLVIAGRVDNEQFQLARSLGEALAAEHTNVSLQTIPMFATDWEEFVKAKSAELGASHPVALPLVYYNTKYYLGGFDEFANWAEKVYKVATPDTADDLAEVSCQALWRFLKTTGRTFVYLDVMASRLEGASEEKLEAKDSVDPETERVVIELFDDLCPKTCQNFLALCTADKQSFAGSPFHRVVENGWVQGGDIVDGSGSNSVGYYGEQFPDETFAVKHDSAGIVSMANDGRPHSNGSQFFIALAPLPWLDLKRVAFGRVVYGMDFVRTISKMPRKNERPLGVCKVYGCGEFAPGDSRLSPQPYTE